METIKIEFQPNIKGKILEFLSSFSSDELTIIEEDLAFEKTRKELGLSYEELKSGTEKMFSVEEVDAALDQEFSIYDN